MQDYRYSNHPVGLWMKRSRKPEKLGTQLAPGEPFRVLRQNARWLYGWAAHYEKLVWVRRNELSRNLNLTPIEWWTSPLVADCQNERPLAVALRYRNQPYFWGGLGLTTEGVDCSGLVHMAFRRTGRPIPRDSDAQEEYGLNNWQLVEWDNLQPGDVITYGEPAGSATHIAFYVGKGEILHATVREDDDISRVIWEIEPTTLGTLRRHAFRPRI